MALAEDDCMSSWSTDRATTNHVIYTWDQASSPPPRRWVDTVVQFFAAVGAMFTGLQALKLAYEKHH